MNDTARADGALTRVVDAANAIRTAEVQQAEALVDLAESYSVELDPLVEVLAEKGVFVGLAGTPEVSEFLALELGPALGMSQRGAWAVVASVLNLKYRHPLVWEAFRECRISRWQADKLVTLTAALTPEAAGKVDARIARSLGRIAFPRLVRLTKGWVAQADPVRAAELEAYARSRRGVWVEPESAGTREVWARLRARDAVALDKTLSDLAVAFGEAGDERPYAERRAAALGMLADPAAALDWLGDDHPVRAPRRRARSVVYVHLAAETMVDPASGVARIEGYGPLTAQSLPDFLSGSNVTVRPVVDPELLEPVDSYEIPDRIRDAVYLVSPHETFPFSSVPSRGLDLDHTTPYSLGRLEAQTGVRNLGPLGRRVHRAKTAGAWRVRQVGGLEFHWRSPLGREYVVGPTGSAAVKPRLRQ